MALRKLENKLFISTKLKTVRSYYKSGLFKTIGLKLRFNIAQIVLDEWKSSNLPYLVFFWISKMQRCLGAWK